MLEAFWVYQTFDTCLISLCRILTLGNALQPKKWSLLDPMLAPKVQVLINDVLLFQPYGNFLSWFLVFYSWHVYQKSNYGYTSSEGWTYCEFVDYRLFCPCACPLQQTTLMGLYRAPCRSRKIIEDAYGDAPPPPDLCRQAFQDGISWCIFLHFRSEKVSPNDSNYD